MGLTGSKYRYVIVTTCETREELLSKITHLEHDATGYMSGQWCFTGNYTTEKLDTFARLSFVQEIRSEQEESNGYQSLGESQV